MSNFPTDIRGRVSSSVLNVKPKLHLAQQRVDFYTTDLSDTLSSDYGILLMGFEI